MTREFINQSRSALDGFFIAFCSVVLSRGPCSLQIQKNKFDSNEFNDVLLYKSNDVPTLEPYTGINVGNIIK